MGSGGLELPPGDEGHEGNSPDVPPGTVSLARPMETTSIGPELDWDPEAWRETTGAALPPDTAASLEAMFRHYDRHGLVGGWRVLAQLLGREPASPAAVLAGAARLPRAL